MYFRRCVKMILRRVRSVRKPPQKICFFYTFPIGMENNKNMQFSNLIDIVFYSISLGERYRYRFRVTQCGVKMIGNGDLGYLSRFNFQPRLTPAFRSICGFWVWENNAETSNNTFRVPNAKRLLCKICARVLFTDRFP